MVRIEGGERAKNGGVGQIGIASAGSTRVGRIAATGEMSTDIEGESGTPGHDGIEAPAFYKAFGTARPDGIEGQVPSTTKADAIADVAVAGGVVQVGAVSRHDGVAL